MATHQLDLSTDTKELPASPHAPTKEEILANSSNEDEVAPLKPTKVIKMRRQTLRKRAATAANRLAGGRSTRDWDVHRARTSRPTCLMPKKKRIVKKMNRR